MCANANINASICIPQKIDLLIFDFDGVFTDNTVIVKESGEESVTCNRADGLGIAMLHKLGIPMLILTRETNTVVVHRANKMKVPVIHGAKDKGCVLKDLIDKRKLNPENIIYVGDDVNDIGCMRVAGVSVCPQNAHPDVKKIATIHLTQSGGRGAVRELVDYILESRSKRGEECI